MKLNSAYDNYSTQQLEENVRDPLAKATLILRSPFFKGNETTRARALTLANELLQPLSIPLKEQQQLLCLAIAHYTIGMNGFNCFNKKNAAELIEHLTIAASLYTQLPQVGDAKNMVQKISAESAFALFEYYKKNNRGRLTACFLLRALILDSTKARDALINSEPFLPLAVFKFVIFSFIDLGHPDSTDHLWNDTNDMTHKWFRDILNEYQHAKDNEAKVTDTLLAEQLEIRPDWILPLLIQCHTNNVISDDLCLAVLTKPDLKIAVFTKDTINYYLFHHALKKAEETCLDYLSQISPIFTQYKYVDIMSLIKQLPEDSKNKILSAYCKKIQPHLEVLLNQFKHAKEKNAFKTFLNAYYIDPIQLTEKTIIDNAIFNLLTEPQKIVITHFTHAYNLLFLLPNMPPLQADFIAKQLTALSDAIPFIPRYELQKSAQKLNEHLGIAKRLPAPAAEKQEESADNPAELIDFIESAVDALVGYLDQRQQMENDSKFVLFKHKLDQFYDSQTDWLVDHLRSLKKQWANVRNDKLAQQNSLGVEFMKTLKTLAETFPASKSHTLNPLIRHLIDALKTVCPQTAKIVEETPQPATEKNIQSSSGDFNKLRLMSFHSRRV